jgi:hypothetical protein
MKSDMFEVRSEICQECLKIGEIFFPCVLWIPVTKEFLNALKSMCASYWLTYSIRILWQTMRYLWQQQLSIVCKVSISIIPCQTIALFQIYFVLFSFSSLMTTKIIYSNEFYFCYNFYLGYLIGLVIFLLFLVGLVHIGLGFD